MTKSLAVDAFPVKSSASSQYATVNKAKVRTSVRKIITKQTFVRNAQTKKINETTPMKTRKKPIWTQRRVKTVSPCTATRQTRQVTRSDDHHGDSLPNPALKACVVRPTDASCPAGANDENAAKDGLRVPPRDKKNAPNVQNTTDGKVFPSTNSRSPVVNWSKPPKKKNSGLDGVSMADHLALLRSTRTHIPLAALLAAPRHCIRSHDKGVRASRNPTRPLLGTRDQPQLMYWKRRILGSMMR